MAEEVEEALLEAEEEVLEELEEEVIAEELDELVAGEGTPDIKLFGKWSFDDIEIRDISLVVSLRGLGLLLLLCV